MSREGAVAMGAGHAHGLGHAAGHGAPAGHAGARHRWRLAAAFVVTGAFFRLQPTWGLPPGPLALLYEGGHRAAGVGGVGGGVAATNNGAGPDPSGRRTYGSYRVEIFAS